MVKTLSHTSHSIFESRGFYILYAGLCSVLKSSLAFSTASEPKTILTEHLKYDSGEIDLRPIAHYSITKVDYQNSLDAMLMRSF